MFRRKLPGFAAKFWLTGLDAPPSLLLAVNRVIASVQPKVLAARLRAVLICNAMEALSHTKVPILCIQAKQDRLVKMSCLEEMLRANQHINVITVDGPHLILQRSPLKSAEAIVQFIRSEIDGDLA
jgi:pimeloyl-ACP methyl ester carboxylesterase